MEFQYSIDIFNGRFEFEDINTKRFKNAQKGSIPGISENDLKGHAVLTKIHPSAMQKSTAVARVSFSFLLSRHTSRKVKLKSSLIRGH